MNYFKAVVVFRQKLNHVKMGEKIAKIYCARGAIKLHLIIFLLKSSYKNFFTPQAILELIAYL